MHRVLEEEEHSFHCYSDGSVRPIANFSRFCPSPREIAVRSKKEALALVFAIHKLFQYLFGQKSISVTDHKPLFPIYGKKKFSGMVANRLAR